MCTHKVVENLNGWSCKVRLPTSTLTGTYLATLVRWIFSTLPLLCVTVNEAKKLIKKNREAYEQGGVSGGIYALLLNHENLW